MRTIRKLVQSSSQSRGAGRWLIGGPTLRPSGLVRTLKSDFQGARDLMMSMAYFAPNPGFLRRLGRIGERGAATVVTAARSDNNVTIDAARHCYRSEEHTSELQSLMRISYAVFCLKKKNTQHQKK